MILKLPYKHLKRYEEKPIGLCMSGGTDSSLLYYLLQEQQYWVVPIIFCHADRPSMVEPVYNVIIEVGKRFGFDRSTKPRVIYSPMKNTELLWNGVHEGNEDLLITRGTTRNPPINEMDGDQSDRAWELPEMDTWDGKEWKPFINMHKRDLALLYKEYSLDWLFELTVSCIGHFENTANFTKSCNQCWWCAERHWAFGTTGQDWRI